MTDSPDNLIDQHAELKALSELLDDEHFNEALEMALKIISKPAVMPGAAQPLINRLQAISYTFAMKKQYYMTVGTRVPNAKQKKNVYYTAQEALDRLVDALKYVIK